jgi:thiol-disulfide isomerase/thioredoxin
MASTGEQTIERWIVSVVTLALVLIGTAAAAQRSAARPGPEVTNRTDCGFNDDPAPDCALEDMNPTSPTYGETVQLSDYDDKVVFLMFMRSSCGHCMTTSVALQALLDAHAGEWGDDVVFLIINMPGWEADLPAFCALSDLPVLQDTTAQYFGDRIGASLYSNYVLLHDRDLHATHYNLSLPTNEARLVSEIQAALGSKRR